MCEAPEKGLKEALNNYSTLLHVVSIPWRDYTFLGTSINPRSSNESSTQDQQHEMAAESTVQFGDSGHPNYPRISNESSIQHQDYEIVDESNVQYGDSQLPPLHQSTPSEESTEDHSEENIKYEGYSSLRRDFSAPLAEPVVYTKLHVYANISSNES